MFEEEIEKIRVLIPAALGNSLETDQVAEFEKLWHSGATMLATRSSSKRTFFRDTLMLTIKLNRRFTIDEAAGNRVRRTVLEAFLDNDTSEDTLLDGYSEQDSRPSLSQPSLSKPVEEHSSKHHIFSALMAEMSNQFDARYNVDGAMKQELMASIPRMGISARSRMVVERWATSEPFLGSFDRMTEDDMRVVIDQIYTLYCNEWGPSVADTLFSEAAESVERHPDARRFPPRQLL